MGAFDELRQGMKDIERLSDPSTGEVRVACSEAIASGLLSMVTERFVREHPHVVVRVSGANNRDFRLLRDRSVDFLVGGIEVPFSEDDLEAVPLYRERLHVVAGSQSRWARRRNISLPELADERWLFPGDPAFSALISEAFKATGVKAPKASATIYSIHQRVSLLATGNFVSALSDSVLRQNADRFALKILPVNFASPTWEVGIVTLKKRTTSAAGQAFIGSIREVARLTTKR